MRGDRRHTAPRARVCAGAFASKGVRDGDIRGEKVWAGDVGAGDVGGGDVPEQKRPSERRAYVVPLTEVDRK